MTGVLEGFTTIALVIGLGVFLGHIGLLDLAAQRMLARLAFFVATPALLVTLLSRADLGEALSGQLWATVVAVAVVAGTYIVVARRVWHRGPGHLVIGAFCASYVNAGNLGIPIAAYVLGDATLAVPTLLMQLLLLQPAGMLVLDRERTGSRGLTGVLRGLATNPLTLAAGLGIGLSASGAQLPALIGDPVALVGDMAVPMILIAYGVSLRLGPRIGDAVGAELVLISGLKLVAMPLLAYLVAHLAFGISGHELFAIVVMAALPTAQNVFVHATRFDRAVVLARDSIFVTTLGAVPVIVVVALLLG